MRLYIDGKMSVEQECFLPETLWFATDDSEDTIGVTEACVCLEAHEFKSKTEGLSFSCRWKGVTFCREEDGAYTESDDFSVEEFLQYITERKMRLRNMSAYYDQAVDITVESVVIIDSKGRYTLEPGLFDVIEFA